MSLCPECGYEEPTDQWTSLPSAQGGETEPCARCQVIKQEYNRLDSIASLEKRIAAGEYQNRRVLDSLINEGSRLESYENRKRGQQKRRARERNKNQS